MKQTINCKEKQKKNNKKQKMQNKKKMATLKKVKNSCWIWNIVVLIEI